MNEYYIWLRRGDLVEGVDYRELNKVIYKYNQNRFYRLFDFWAFLSFELLGENAIPYSGYSRLWNEHNSNMCKVLAIRRHD